jgi:hypothetical protein
MVAISRPGTPFYASRGKEVLGASPFFFLTYRKKPRKRRTKDEGRGLGTRNFRPLGGNHAENAKAFWNGRIRRVPHAMKQLEGKAFN